jgi:hypothetical protein
LYPKAVAGKAAVHFFFFCVFADFFEMPIPGGSAKTQWRLWLGCAYFTRKVHPPERGGVNFDLLLIFCACSMQNAPGNSVMLQMDFRTKQKVLPTKRVFEAQAGCGDAISLYKNLVKNTKT